MARASRGARGPRHHERRRAPLRTWRAAPRGSASPRSCAGDGRALRPDLAATGGLTGRACWLAPVRVRVRARGPPVLPAERGDALLRVDLSPRAELAARGARGGARRGAHHIAAVEQPARPPDARAPVERRAVRRDPPRLASGALRA